jgi:hypothetical protein
MISLSMSADEIMSELAKLTRAELEAVGARLHQLLAGPTGSRNEAVKNWGEALTPLAGSVDGLPDDLALNHDHYLHRAPKR